MSRYSVHILICVMWCWRSMCVVLLQVWARPSTAPPPWIASTAPGTMTKTCRGPRLTPRAASFVPAAHTGRGRPDRAMSPAPQRVAPAWNRKQPSGHLSVSAAWCAVSCRSSMPCGGSCPFWDAVTAWSVGTFKLADPPISMLFLSKVLAQVSL